MLAILLNYLNMCQLDCLKGAYGDLKHIILIKDCVSSQDQGAHIHWTRSLRQLREIRPIHRDLQCLLRSHAVQCQTGENCPLKQEEVWSAHLKAQCHIQWLPCAFPTSLPWTKERALRLQTLDHPLRKTGCWLRLGRVCCNEGPRPDGRSLVPLSRQNLSYRSGVWNGIGIPRLSDPATHSIA